MLLQREAYIVQHMICFYIRFGREAYIIDQSSHAEGARCKMTKIFKLA